MLDSRAAVRAGLSALVVVSAAVLAYGFLTDPGAGEGLVDQGEFAPVEGELTVVTTQKGPRGGMLAVFDGDGDTVYRNATYDAYWDVDPAPDGEHTLEFVASREVHGPDCPDAGRVEKCFEVVIQQENVSTGGTSRLYSRIDYMTYTDRFGPSESLRWHDVDRVNDTHFVVADNEENRVVFLDVRTGIVTWEWEAESAFSPESGGVYPYDWTHVNDVELVRDGRVIQVSLRNQDQVIHLDRRTGRVRSSFTLGADDRHDILYEQHNPDYIPASRGGPAVLVGDSENNRVVEYQHEDGNWTRTWLFTDARLQWPRDADRLPNDHTLVTDSLGDRVIEVDESGEVVYSVDIAVPYEAERLETPDESGGGTSARRADLQSRSPETVDRSPSLGQRVKSLFPSKLVNALQHVTPGWMGVVEFGALVVFVVAGTLLAVFEAYARWTVSLRSPLLVDRR